MVPIYGDSKSINPCHSFVSALKATLRNTKRSQVKAMERREKRTEAEDERKQGDVLPHGRQVNYF